MATVLAGVELETDDNFGHRYLVIRVPGRETVLIGLAAATAGRELVQELSRLVETHGRPTEEE